MAQDPPFFVDVTVPEAVLLNAVSRPAEGADPNSAGAVWYRADLASVACDADGSVQCWHPQAGLGRDAIPAKPNAGNLHQTETGALAFTAESNGGLVIEQALVEPEAFSIAVRYASDLGEARSLVTVNPPEVDTYLFLAEKDGRITWQDQQDFACLTLPAPKGGGWVIAGYTGGRISLATAPIGGAVSAVQDTSAAADALKGALAGVADLFIGCRSHRKGILKTLGQSHVHDVLLWIDQDVTGGDPTALATVLRHCEAQGAAA